MDRQTIFILMADNYIGLENDVKRHEKQINEMLTQIHDLSTTHVELGSILKVYMENYKKETNELSIKLDKLTDMFLIFSTPKKEDWELLKEVESLKSWRAETAPVINDIQRKIETIKHLGKYKYWYAGLISFLLLVSLKIIPAEYIPYINTLFTNSQNK